jgi:hypothetical protein
MSSCRLSERRPNSWVSRFTIVLARRLANEVKGPLPLSIGGAGPFTPDARPAIGGKGPFTPDDYAR